MFGCLGTHLAVLPVHLLHAIVRKKRGIPEGLSTFSVLSIFLASENQSEKFRYLLAIYILLCTPLLHVLEEVTCLQI